MAEPIVTKHCCACKQIKPVSEFSKSYSKKDGFQTACKVCKEAYQRSDKCKVARKQRYTQTEKYKAGQRRYDQTKKRKIAKRKRQLKYDAKYPERRKAISAVNYAVKTGKLPRPDTLQCSCGKQAQEYHHYKGYAKKHWLDVIPKCIKCHKNIPYN